MTRPALAAFLEAPISDSGGSGDGSDAVKATQEGLLAVLAEVVAMQGTGTVAEQTGLDRKLLDSVEEGTPPERLDAVAGLTLETAAEILAVDSAFSPTEIRHRIRDHLLVQMSRGPVDAESVASAYGFGDGVALQEMIEGTRPFSLREYARLRVALD